MKAKQSSGSTARESAAPAARHGRDGLRVGDVVTFEKSKWVVWFKNDSRAAIAPLDSRIDYRISEDDGKIRFLARGQSENISAHSEVEILESLGRKGLAELIDSAKISKANTMAKDKKSEKTETKNRAGKLGGYKGHSITSLIRAMGAAGWTLDEARAFFEKKEIQVADATIKIQLRAGKVGEGGDPAPIPDDELAKMKPKVAKKEKAANIEKKAKGKKAKKQEEDEAGEDDETVNEDVEPDEEEEEVKDV